MTCAPVSAVASCDASGVIVMGGGGCVRASCGRACACV